MMMKGIYGMLVYTQAYLWIVTCATEINYPRISDAELNLNCSFR